MSKSLKQLGDLGADYRDPIAAIDWDAGDPSLPWLPPDLLSLAGCDLQRRMPPAALCRFSRVEFARLCAAGLWIEGLLMGRLTANGRCQTVSEETRIVLREVRDEAGHGLMFVEMIERAGLAGVPLLGDTRLLSWVARRLKPESAEFWAVVYLGESVTDNLAVRALRAPSGSICPLARQILSLHHKDEARHIAAGRALFRARLSAMSAARRRVFTATLPFLLKRFLEATFYPTAAGLAASGFARSAAMAQAAAANPARRDLAQACAAPPLRFLARSFDTAAARGPAPPTRITPIFVGSEVYRRRAYGSNHPLSISRTATVMDLCRILGWLDDGAFKESPQASAAELAGFHRPDYIDALRRADEAGRTNRETRERYGLSTMENPVFPGVYERAATSVGGSILAAELAMEGCIVYHPAGGTHHGHPDKARGFCYFNDPVLSIQRLLARGLKRIYYVDLDAHFGDGVHDAFADDNRVFTLSIHEAGRWPYTGAVEDRAGGAARNLPVPKGFNDSELDHLMQEAVLPLGAGLAPEAVVITCGADGLAGDPLSGMALSNVALWGAVERLTRLSRRTVILGGGGYNPWTVARCWTGLWGRLRGHDVFSPLPDEAQDVMRGLSSDLVDEDEIPVAWHTQLADRPNPGPVRREVAALVPAVLAP